MSDSLAGFWAWFIGGFCKVEFLCSEGSPNWLGWILLGVVFLFIFLFILALTIRLIIFILERVIAGMAGHF